MLLAQISDIHCGPVFRKESLRTAIKEINAMSPDIVLVTGDLTENGLISEFETASKEMKGLKAEKIIYVSGARVYEKRCFLTCLSFWNSVFLRLFDSHSCLQAS